MAEDTQSSIIEIEKWLPSEMATTIVIPSPEAHVSMLDDRAILLNLDTGAYHALNSVGTVIWELFTHDRPLSAIHSEMCSRYDVDEKTACHDLLELVTRLYRSGLIQFKKNAS